MTLPVRTMGLTGVEEAVSWAEAEGWEPGLGDAAPFYAADPHGFFCSRSDGRTVATISVIRGSGKVAFVGLYIVAPDARGQGHGRALWDEVLARFDGFTLGLDAVPEQVGSYASDGFRPAYGNARFSVDAGRLPGVDHEIELVPAPAVPFEQLVAFDGVRFFGPRPDFLRPWISGDGRDALVAMDGDEITGFAASRRTSTGSRIGPVFTAGPEIARALILSLSDGMKGPVSVDIPRPNHAAEELLRSLGMEPSFETTRMYRGEAPDLPLDQIFGITTLELG